MQTTCLLRYFQTTVENIGSSVGMIRNRDSYR